jgi:hypothetical protein
MNVISSTYIRFLGGGENSGESQRPKICSFVTGLPPQKMHRLGICYTILVEKKAERKQKTPKGHEIPVPTKKEFLDNIEKAAKSTSNSPKK